MNIRKVIKELKKDGMYSATGEKGEDIIVMRSVGHGVTVMIENSKGNFECIDYDEDGYRKCEYVMI